MRKNTLAIASVAAIASFLSLSGIMITQNANAQDSSTEDQHYQRVYEKQTRFWGDYFNEDQFNERYEVMRQEREARQQEREDEFNNSELSSYLGLTFEELKTLRDEGTTLRSYIQENNLDEDVVKDLMKEEIISHLDERLEEGFIDQDRYDEMVENIDDMLERRLDGEGGPRGEMGGSHRGGPRGGFRQMMDSSENEADNS